jgi:hypothetical protein
VSAGVAGASVVGADAGAQHVPLSSAVHPDSK